jgi:opacity protein-like surface antigen
MRTFQLYIVVVILACTHLAGICTVSAEDGRSGFSLGFNSLTAERTDPGAEQFGQLVARYQVSSLGNFRPYLATGLGYSYQPDIKTDDSVRVRTGVAGQAGFRYLLGEKSSLTFDYKFLDLGADESHDSGSSTPQSVGVGLEIKF